MKLEKIYGLHAVQLLFKTGPHRVQDVWVLQGREDKKLQKLLQVLRKQQCAVSMKSRKELDAAADGGNHQGILVFATPGISYDESSLFDLLDKLDAPPFLLVLDGVTDPHNLGACLRTAEAAGVHAVIAPKDNSVGLTDTVRKVACGAADVVPFVPVTNLARCLDKLKEAGVWLIGTAGEATLSIYDAPLTGGIALVMGAEGDGLRRLTRETCDHLVYIPMAGEVSSLNVSVAAGVCLFEAVRRR